MRRHNRWLSVLALLTKAAAQGDDENDDDDEQSFTIPEPLRTRPRLTMAVVMVIAVWLLRKLLRCMRLRREQSSVGAIKRRADDFDRYNPRPSSVVPSYASTALPPTIKRYAAQGDERPVLQWLASNRGRPDAADADGRTALYHACEHGRAKLARQLLEGGCGLDTADARGATPLHAACAAGAAGAVRVLLDAGVDVGRVDSDGRTPSTLAAARGHSGCARLVRRRERDQRAGMASPTLLRSRNATSGAV
jgi:hypothetical protein